LGRAIIYMAISDLLRAMGVDADKSRNFIFSVGDNKRHFQEICDIADFDSEWVQDRIRKAMTKKVSWRSVQNIGERVLGQANLSHQVNNMKRLKCQKK